MREFPLTSTTQWRGEICRHRHDKPTLLARVRAAVRQVRTTGSCIAVYADSKSKPAMPWFYRTSAAGMTHLPRPVQYRSAALPRLLCSRDFYQGFGALRLLRIVDDQILVALRIRIVLVWAAIEPFVARERELNTATGTHLMRILEDFAVDAAKIPFDAVERNLAKRRLH